MNRPHMERQMSFVSSNGEVFGTGLLYAVMIAISLILLLSSVSNLSPPMTAPGAQAPAHAVETVVVTAKAGNVS